MNCEQYERLLATYECGEAGPDELMQMAQHELSCPHCAALRKSSDEILAGLEALKEDVPEMPEDFHSRWTSAIRKEKTSKPKHFVRIIGIAAACLVVLLGVVSVQARLRQNMQTLSYSERGDSASVTYEDGYYGGYAAESAYDADYEVFDAAYESAPAVPALGMNAMSELGRGASDSAGETGGGYSEVSNDRKIIRTISMDLVTNSFDDSFESLKKLSTDNGGWTSSSYVTTMSSGLKRADITMRIPARNLEQFLNGTTGIGRITSQKENAEDVTDSYRDTQTRLKTQEMLLERLQNLVTTTKKLEDLLQLEDQIADKQYTIDMLTSTLKKTDNAVNYSTVDITLREEKPKEVVETKTLSFGDRIAAAFRVGIESFLEFLSDTLLLIVAILPYLVLLLILAGIVILIIRRIRKRRKS